MTSLQKWFFLTKVTAVYGRLSVGCQYYCPQGIRLTPLPASIPLSMDRTNWKFGSADINSVFIGIIYEWPSFPIVFKMIPVAENFYTSARIELLVQFIRLFGINCIDCLMAVKKFVRKKWIGYLHDNRIKYHIHIRENF